MLHNIFAMFSPVYRGYRVFYRDFVYNLYKKELKKYLVSQGKSLSLGEFLKRSTVLTLNEPNIMMEKRWLF